MSAFMVISPYNLYQPYQTQMFIEHGDASSASWKEGVAATMVGANPVLVMWIVVA